METYLILVRRSAELRPGGGGGVNEFGQHGDGRNQQNAT